MRRPETAHANMRQGETQRVGTGGRERAGELKRGLVGSRVSQRARVKDQGDSPTWRKREPAGSRASASDLPECLCAGEQNGGDIHMISVA